MQLLHIKTSNEAKIHTPSTYFSTLKAYASYCLGFRVDDGLVLR